MHVRCEAHAARIQVLGALEESCFCHLANNAVEIDNQEILHGLWWDGCIDEFDRGIQSELFVPLAGPQASGIVED